MHFPHVPKRVLGMARTDELLGGNTGLL